MQLYRRHTETCPHAAKGAGYTRCRCPIYADGVLPDGKRFRRSMKTRSWTDAEAVVASIQAAPAEEQRAMLAPSLAQAIGHYIADLKFRRRSENTVIGYKCQLGKFLDAMGEAGLREINTDVIQRYLAGKEGKFESEIRSSTLRKEIAVLRAFYEFCMKKGWAGKNPAKDVTKPPVPRFVTKPFERLEMDKMFEAAETIPGRRGVETRALLHVLAYTGLRVSDVATLRIGAYDRRTGYLTLPWTEKTGAPIRIKLASSVVSALDALPKDGGDYWFKLYGKIPSQTKVLRRRIVKLGLMVGVNAKPHRFRDTFAVELLSNGSDLRTVQHLLGHDSIETTERHYAHFVAEHQSILDKATATLKFGDRAPRPFLVNSGKD